MKFMRSLEWKKDGLKIRTDIEQIEMSVVFVWTFKNEQSQG